MRRQRCALVIAWAFSAVLAAFPSSSFGWSSAGHKLVVAVALQFDPTLRGRINRVLANLPESSEWRALEATGSAKEPVSSSSFLNSVLDNPENAATFPDWASQYKGYNAQHFDEFHSYELNYMDGGTSFVHSPNSLTALENFEQAVRSETGGSQAWALVWVLNLVGDMHEPLLTTSRPLGTGSEDDNGGAAIRFGKESLHEFWEHLPDREVGLSPDLCAERLVREFRMEPQEDQDALLAKAGDLSLEDWVADGRQAIQSVGYPSDKKVADYDDAALAVANHQIILAGARLAALLKQILPN